MKKLITINRQFGSGGREVGKRLADALDCAYYDKELLNAIMEETGMVGSGINLYDEKATRNYGYTFGRTFTTFQQSPSDKLQIAVNKIIKQSAQKGDAVFIGRCSDYVLRELNPFKVFIYSSNMDFRVERCFEAVPEDRSSKGEKGMIKEILAVDKTRAKYHAHYTGLNCEDMKNYNLCVDTSEVGVKGAVEVILLALSLRK